MDVQEKQNQERGSQQLIILYICPTKQSDDIRMVEILHAGRLVQELFNLPLREAVH